MIQLESASLSVQLHPKGAELQSLFDKTTQQEYMWEGDPAIWGKHSPVLFPIVGTLKSNSFHYGGHDYSLSRHGFARDSQFELVESSTSMARFRLESNDATKKVYPFDFRFDLVYLLEGKSLSVVYEVTNMGAEEMFFSVGAHPAFRLPIEEGTGYEDYYLEFEKNETKGRWPISKDGLIELQENSLLENTNILPLKKDLFYKDAIVLKQLVSEKLWLKSDKTKKGFQFDFPGFDFMGIWAAKDADFVCIEPWCGIADSVDSNQDIREKEGIHRLLADELFSRTWTVTVF